MDEWLSSNIWQTVIIGSMMKLFTHFILFVICSLVVTAESDMYTYTE